MFRLNLLRILPITKACFVAEIAEVLVKNGATMRVTLLMDLLNQNNFRTKDGNVYEGGRGSYRFTSSLYDYFKELGYQKASDDIASAFVRAEGSYAYEN